MSHHHHHEEECHEGHCCHHHHAVQPACCHEDHDTECDTAHDLLDLADMAWMEVLKEKIKDHIRANDQKIDELAAIVADINKERWHHKMAKEKICEDFERRLKDLFNKPVQKKK